jgi:hypothetical protein
MNQKFETKEKLVESIKLLFDKTSEGTISSLELDKLVTQTRELYERALIIRYKSYEEKVYGEIQPINDFSEEKVDETIIEELFTETKVSEIPKDVNKISDFKIFDEEKPTLDFSIFENEETWTDENQKQQITDTEEQLEKKSAYNELSNEENTAFTEQKEEVVEFNDTDVFAGILKNDNTLGSILMLSKIDTLVGAFGFNEKLQCIQELFDGSSETFNEVILKLDAQADFSDAKKVLIELYNKHNWELDNAVTIDFIQKVERRFA